MKLANATFLSRSLAFGSLFSLSIHVLVWSLSASLNEGVLSNAEVCFGYEIRELVLVCLGHGFDTAGSLSDSAQAFVEEPLSAFVENLEAEGNVFALVTKGGDLETNQSQVADANGECTE